MPRIRPIRRIRLSAPVAALALALLAVASTAARAGIFNPETFTLDNGMQVVVVSDHRAPVVTHMVWYKVGAADEPAGKSGIAHFLEHLMFRGTKNLADGEFSKIIARNGGRDNAFTSYDYTGYFQQVAVDKLDLVMGLEADRMVNLQLTEAVVAPERNVIIEERRQRVDTEPASLLGEQTSAAQFLSHPYGVPVIGWEHEIRGLTLKDVVDFYRVYYSPNNAILVVVGDVEAEDVRALAEKHFGAIPPQALPPRVRPSDPPQIAERRVIYRDSRVSQANWRRSWLAPTRSAGRTEHAVPLDVLSEILGGGSTSRLYRALVVEQGLAAGASAGYDSVSLDPSVFWMFVQPKPDGDIATVEAAVEAVVERLLQDGITDEELQRAKSKMLASAVYARDSMGTAARIFGSALTSGLTVEDIETWPDLVKAVTVDQVNAAARFVLRPETSVTGILLPEPQS